MLFVLGIPSVFSSAYRNVQHHPLLVLADDSTRRSLIDDAASGPRGGGRRRSSRPVETGPRPREHDPRLADVVRACRGGSRPPNVLLIVLESVGSLQLLGSDGLPSAQVTPHLAKLAQGGVVFDSVYSVFPGHGPYPRGDDDGRPVPHLGERLRAAGPPLPGPHAPARLCRRGL